MSYLENTPFSLVTIDPSTGENLSPEAIENRKRLILLWKIQNEKQAAMFSDINDPRTHTEEALTGDEFLSLIHALFSWGQSSSIHPVLKIEKLEQLAALRYDDSPDPSSMY